MEDGDLNILARQVSKRLKYQTLLEEHPEDQERASLNCEPTPLEISHTHAIFALLDCMGFEIRVKA